MDGKCAKKGGYLANAILFVVLLTSYGCMDKLLDPYAKGAPIAKLSVFPSTGEVPLLVHFTVSGDHSEGVSMINKYILEVDGADGYKAYMEKSVPIDTVLVFHNPVRYSIKGITIDSNGISNTRIAYRNLHGFPQQEPRVPGALQNVILKNLVEIKYMALMEESNEAYLEVRRDGELIMEITLRESAYSTLLTYQTNKDITKGNYDFILRWKTSANKDTSITSSIPIPDYAHEILNNFNFDASEDGIVIDFERIIKDPNPEDAFLMLKNAWAVDGYTQVETEENKLIIKNAEFLPEFGNYKFLVEYMQVSGQTQTVLFDGSLLGLLHIEGFLEDSETHSACPGLIKMYEYNGISGAFKNIGLIQVNDSGEFRRILNYRLSASYLPYEVLIQARKIDSETKLDASYIRTARVPKGDIREYIIRVVPYDGLEENGITPEDFRRHAAEVTYMEFGVFPETDPIKLNPTIYRWNFGEDPNAPHSFREVIISKTPQLTSEQGHFTQQTAERIAARILDPEDVGALFRGKIANPSYIKIVENWIFEQPRDEGKIIIYPEISKGGSANFGNNQGYRRFGRIKLGVNEHGELYNNDALPHEIGHVAGFPGHAFTLSRESTIMRGDWVPGHPPRPMFADRKLAHALYEPTYLQGTGTGDLNKTNLLRIGDILGLKWLDD